MARISTYAIDGTVDNMDKLLGSTQDGTTANFTADVIADYYLRHGGAESSKHGLPFAYGGTIAGLANIPSSNAGMIYVYDADPDASVDDTFSNIGTLLVSTSTNTADPSNSIDVAPILNQYVGEIIKVAGATTTGGKNYALYRVTAVGTDVPSGLYTLDVDYVADSSVGAAALNDADPYNAIVLVDVAAGDVQLGGLIRNVSVTPNVSDGTYTLEIEPQSGDAFTSTWTDVSSTLLSGADAPLASVGSVGDFYIQNSGSTRIIFGPKASNDSWGTGVTLNGTDGNPVDGVQVISGGVNPGDTTVIQFTVDGSLIAVPVTIQPGEDGADGAAGRGINGVTVVDGNALRITYTDGTAETTDPLNFNQIQSDWNETDTGDAAYIQNKPENLTTFSDTEAGSVYTWAEGANTDLIPVSKLPAQAFETHVFAGNYTQLKADTTETFRDGEIWILDAPAAGDSNAYLFVGANGSQGPTDDDDWVPFQSTGANLDVNPQANTVVITNTAGTNATIPAAGTSAGVMTAADKSKLESIAGGAEVNVQSNWTETNTSSDAFIQNKPNTITTDQETNIANSKTVTDAIDLNGYSVTNKFVFDDYSIVQVGDSPDGVTPQPFDEVNFDGTWYQIEKGTDVEVDGTGIASLNIIQEVAPVKFDFDAGNGELTIEAARVVGTGSDQTDGLMTHQDKTKLDGIADGANVNVKASWAQADASDDSFIVSKPTLVGAADNPFSGYGFMSLADKQKLDNLVDGGTVAFSTDEAPDGSSTALSVTVYDDEGNEVIWALGGGTEVVANPSGSLPTDPNLASVQIGANRYNIPADEISVNGTSVSDPNLQNSGIFTYTATGSNITFSVAEANVDSSEPSHGILAEADAKNLADTITRSTTNMTNITNLQTAVNAINSFDPENAGTNGQVLTKQDGDNYDWEDAAAAETSVTVKHSGDTDVDNIDTINFVGEGISIARDSSDTKQVNVTITGGGSGGDPITVAAPTWAVDTDKFENEDQTPSFTQTWEKESSVTYVATGSQIVITKGDTTIQTRALTSAELTAGTVTFDTSSLDFVTSNTDNTIVDVVITTTVNGTNSSNDSVSGTHTFTYTFPALQPNITENIFGSPSDWINPSPASVEGSDNFIEQFDAGSWDVDADPAATGWTAGTPTVTFDGNSSAPTGWTYTSTGSTHTLTAAANDDSLAKMKIVTTYTQTTVPSGKTAITRDVTVLDDTDFTRGISVRYGMAPADSGEEPTFVDSTAANYGVRNLGDFTGTDRNVLWGTTAPSASDILEITNTVTGSFLYFCYVGTEDNLTKVTEAGFPKSLTDFTGPTTVGDYKCYINKTGYAATPVGIDYTIQN